MWDELPDDVRLELIDPDYQGLQHYSRATYARGCRGPLCRLSETHRGRRRNKVRAQEGGREYQPRGSFDPDREEYLGKIATWHLMERGRVDTVTNTIVTSRSQSAKVQTGPQSPPQSGTESGEAPHEAA